MKLIKQKAELLPWIPGIEGVYKMIELAGRTCYKSTDKITEDSAKPFVDRMINSKHTAMLEHGTIYLYIEEDDEGSLYYFEFIEKYKDNKYSRVNENPEEVDGTNSMGSYITTNLRVLVENNWLDDLKYLCDPTEYHEKRYTFRLITSIGVTRELNRHRVNSIAEQSTRYCNYSKDKFGGEVSFVEPYWLELNKPINSDAYDNAYELFASACEEAEGYYMFLIDNGFTPQEAREVLPLCTASEIVHTAFASDWKHFFDLRYYGTTGAPHPNMKQLAELMKNELDKNGIKLD
jgi:thymidylate synthase (FAD)